MSSISCRLLVTGLALMALGWAQLFGMSRGYLCDCGGEFQLTAHDHCHGPHSAACHDHEETAPCHEHDDLPADDDTQHHRPVKETVLAHPTNAKASASIVPAMVLMTAFEALTLRGIPGRPFVIPIALLRDDGGGGRRWPQILARTIALRV